MVPHVRGGVSASSAERSGVSAAVGAASVVVPRGTRSGGGGGRGSARRRLPGGLLSGGGGAAATTGDVGAALDAFAADLSDFVDDLVKDVGRAAKIDDSRNL